METVNRTGQSESGLCKVAVKSVDGLLHFEVFLQHVQLRLSFYGSGET